MAICEEIPFDIHGVFSCVGKSVIQRLKVFRNTGSLIKKNNNNKTDGCSLYKLRTKSEIVNLVDCFNSTNLILPILSM